MGGDNTEYRVLIIWPVSSSYPSTCLVCVCVNSLRDFAAAFIGFSSADNYESDPGKDFLAVLSATAGLTC